MKDSDRPKTFGHVVGKLDQPGIRYVHLVEASEDDIATAHGSYGSPAPS